MNFTNRDRLLVAVGVIALSVVTSLICCLFINSRHTDNSITKQSVYDRILKSGKIRCGYVVYWPGCIKDPNTGKLSGVHVEAMEAIGEKLGLKIVWTEEVGWGSMVEGLQTDRYDVVGSGVWANATRGKYAFFSTPFYYLGPNAYCRANDHRFDSDLKLINSPDVKISTIDGELSEIVARTQFPKAQRISLPDMVSPSQAFLQVTDNKADVFFEDPLSAYAFEKGNPGKIRNIAHDKPLLVFGTAIMFRRGETDLQNMFDKAVDELVFSGGMDHILDKYEPVIGQYYYRRANPYKLAGHDNVNM
jgi:polar amino acid transport system substrate-binding protein